MASPFTADQPFKENNVINESERDAVPANDAGKLVQLEADGHLSRKFLSQKALVRAYKSDSNTITTTTYTKITFGTESYDVGNDFASDTFTAPRDGFYKIHAQARGISQSSTPRSVSMAIYKNGTLYSQISSSNGANSGIDIGLSISDVLQLSATDTIEVYIKSNDPSAMTYNTGEDNTFISVQEL